MKNLYIQYVYCMGENRAKKKKMYILTKNFFEKSQKQYTCTELVSHNDVYKFWLISVFVTNAKGGDC